ncbi:hypothetical protein KS4_35520 [Poriferisphaera corsica]|uniref:Uncharacterized protein n=1 Tax=Poriferisphaera corsica TaxID=2528020 RepID=A0A517YZ51_9BACT|nr:hypothetical protein KS4_35520 [Poriferisphaera corsica]
MSDAGDDGWGGGVAYPARFAATSAVYGGESCEVLLEVLLVEVAEVFRLCGAVAVADSLDHLFFAHGRSLLARYTSIQIGESG